MPMLLRVLIPPAPNNEWVSTVQHTLFFFSIVRTHTHASRLTTHDLTTQDAGPSQVPTRPWRSRSRPLQAVHYAFKSQSGLLNLSLDFLLTLPWKPLKLDPWSLEPWSFDVRTPTSSYRPRGRVSSSRTYRYALLCVNSLDSRLLKLKMKVSVFLNFLLRICLEIPFLGAWLHWHATNCELQVVIANANILKCQLDTPSTAPQQRIMSTCTVFFWDRQDSTHADDSWFRATPSSNS